jgi:hypothetical protein
VINIGATFKSLKPEVQTTLDKIFSQVELVSNTLTLLEKRLIFSEDRMMEVMNYIKDNDVVHRPKIVQGYPQFSHNYLGGQKNPSHCDSMGPENQDFEVKASLLSHGGGISGIGRENTAQSQESELPTPMLGGGQNF